jgi:2-hydroxy-6-oxonona-2,4-dienedioate hydrolase
MKRRGRWIVITSITVAVVGASLWIAWRFESDINVARVKATQGSVLTDTGCGPIEYQETGVGAPLLVVHGSGGGHDQGIALAANLAQRGVRVIAVSRFGYLQTPMPADASPAAQADAHVYLLDALGIAKAAVLGGSAGGPSALQMAIRHSDRVSALVLLVPLAYKPPSQADSAKPLTPWAESLLMQLIGSDFLFWIGLHIARDQVIRYVLATPPEQLANASAEERVRVDAMLNHILPVSARAKGLRSDSVLGKSLGPSGLEKVRAPALIVSVRDDGFGTYAAAQYTASQIKGAKFVGYEQGGHVWIGHNNEVIAEIITLLALTEKTVKAQHSQRRFTRSIRLT